MLDKCAGQNSINATIGHNSRISRRTLLKLSSAIGLAPLGLAIKTAFSADRQITLGMWGGPGLETYKSAYGEHYSKVRNGELLLDGTGPSLGKIKAMVESGAVSWDAADAEAETPIILGKEGLLTPIDYSIVDKSKCISGYATEYGVAIYFYPFLIAYNSEAFGGKEPTGAADFWDVTNFPGQRGMYKYMHGMLEAALLADGVSREKLYPLDVEKAFKKIGELKPNVALFFEAPSEGREALMNGEVAMTYVPLSRALQAEKESGGKMKWIWSGGTCFGTGWCVPKGTPRAEEAQHFLRVCQDPEPQIELIETMGFGPANPEAAALVPDNLKRTNPTDPTNLATPGYGIADPVWYAEKYNETFEKWLQLISA